MKRNPFQTLLGAALLLMIVTLAIVGAASAQSQYKILYTFTGGTDGFAPYGGLVFDAAGNLYGTTELGGQSNCYAAPCGVVFKLAPNQDGTWTQTVIHTFTGGIDQGYPFNTLTIDSTGNLYGTTEGDQESFFGTVFELESNPDGTWTHKLLHAFSGGDDGQTLISGVIFDSVGNLYGTTYTGGAFSHGTIFQLTPNSDGSWTHNVLYSFAGQPDGRTPYGRLLLDASGTLYGTTYAGGTGPCAWGGCGTIFSLSPAGDGSWTEKVLLSFKGPIDGAGPEAGLIFDHAGHLFGTTSAQGPRHHGTVFELVRTSSGWKEKILRAFDDGPWGGDPRSELIFDAAGNLYGAALHGSNFKQGLIYKLSPSSGNGWKETVLYSFGSLYQDGALPAAELIWDAAGNLYGTTSAGGASYAGEVFEITP